MSRHLNPPENTSWSYVEGLMDKKKVAFSTGFTKKLEEPSLSWHFILTKEWKRVFKLRDTLSFPCVFARFANTTVCLFSCFLSISRKC